MNKQTMQELSLIKTVLGTTQVSFRILSDFFLGISIIYIFKELIMRLCINIFHGNSTFINISEIVYLIFLSAFYIFYYKKIFKLQNTNNTLILQVWGVILILCTFISKLVPNIIISKLSIESVPISMNIYAVISQIYQLTLIILPLIMGFFITGIFLNNIHIKWYGLLLCIVYISSFYLYYAEIVYFDIYILYNIIYASAFIVLGINFRLKNKKIMGDFYEDE